MIVFFSSSFKFLLCITYRYLYRNRWRRGQKRTYTQHRPRRTAAVINRSSSVFVANIVVAWAVRAHRSVRRLACGAAAAGWCATTIGLFGRLAHLFRIRKGLLSLSLSLRTLAHYLPPQTDTARGHTHSGRNYNTFIIPVLY